MNSRIKSKRTRKSKSKRYPNSKRSSKERKKKSWNPVKRFFSRSIWNKTKITGATLGSILVLYGLYKWKNGKKVPILSQNQLLQLSLNRQSEYTYGKENLATARRNATETRLEYVLRQERARQEREA